MIPLYVMPCVMVMLVQGVLHMVAWQMSQSWLSTLVAWLHGRCLNPGCIWLHVVPGYCMADVDVSILVIHPGCMVAWQMSQSWLHMESWLHMVACCCPWLHVPGCIWLHVVVPGYMFLVAYGCMLLSLVTCSWLHKPLLHFAYSHVTLFSLIVT